MTDAGPQPSSSSGGNCSCPLTLVTAIASSADLLPLLSSYLAAGDVCKLERCCKLLHRGNYYCWRDFFYGDAPVAVNGAGGEDDPATTIRLETGFIRACVRCYTRPLLRRESSPVAISITNKLQSKQILLRLLAAITNGAENIVDSIASCSSIDRAEEAPTNCLAASACFESFHEAVSRAGVVAASARVWALHGMTAQRQCLCDLWSPCYWSSAPSSRQDGSEHITVRTVSQACVCTGFSLTPYCAFTHPGSPVFAPLGVRLQFLTGPPPSTSCDVAAAAAAAQGFTVKRRHAAAAHVYYESEEQAVESSFLEQIFVLPAPVLVLPSQLVRFVFQGYANRQNLGGEAGEADSGFYTCISNLKLLGAPLQGLELQLGAEVGDASLCLAADCAAEASPNPTAGGRGRRQYEAALAALVRGMQ